MSDYNWADDDARELAVALEQCKWLEAENAKLRAALEEIRDEHKEFDDLAYNIACRALEE